MRVFNKDKTKEMVESNLDLTKGYLKEDVITIHHDAIKGQEEKGHYETIKEYENGGKDVKYIIDQPGAIEQPEYDETINIMVYIPYTKQELSKIQKEERIKELKQLLDDSNKYTFAFIDGYISEKEYQEYKTQRNSYRDELSQLENE